MPWNCRLIDPPTNGMASDGAGGYRPIAVGDIWFADPETDSKHDRTLAPEHAGKRPLLVRLPGNVDFAVYGPTWRAGGPGPNGWRVEGEPPALLISPSINIEGVYHGYLQNGVISDDCEGRKYDAAGRLVR